MVVLVIIGLLATAVVRYVVPNIFKAQTGRVVSDIQVIVEALNQYAIENNGDYPDSLEALVTPDANGYKYLQQDQVPKDPWGGAYKLQAADGVAVVSAGPDRQFGTSDDVRLEK